MTAFNLENVCKVFQKWMRTTSYYREVTSSPAFFKTFSFWLNGCQTGRNELPLFSVYGYSLQFQHFLEYSVCSFKTFMTFMICVDILAKSLQKMYFDTGRSISAMMF